MLTSTASDLHGRLAVGIHLIPECPPERGRLCVLLCKGGVGPDDNAAECGVGLIHTHGY